LAEDDAAALSADENELAETGPTHFPAVPRIYEKIHGVVLGRLADGPASQRALFEWALRQGTRARRVMHVEKGMFRGFLNSRETAAVLGVEPNGSARASEVFYVPLIRMSNTFLMPGESDPQQIIADVERGYYVCGSAVPSIAESRESEPRRAPEWRTYTSVRASGNRASVRKSITACRDISPSKSPSSPSV